ncbi:MAG TPA: serine hydrolase [Acetobacteraceae bacterium]|nr:serine hydrolase [Acetobacteraceae bacterium]
MNDSPGLGMMPTLHPDWFSEGNERTIDSRVPFVPRGRPGLAVPLVYDVSERALRQREMNFAAKRLVDMAFVSKLDWEDALARLRWRGVEPMGGLDAMPDTGPRKARLAAAFEAGAIAIMPDVSARAVRVVWTDPDFGAPVSGGAKAPVGWGGIVTGAREPDAVTSSPIARAAPSGRLWPLGDDVPAPPADDPVLARAVDRFLATSPGVYGVLVAGPDRILFERYGMGGAPDRVTPSWSMNKSMTGTLIGRLIQLGWLEGVHVPAPAPAWRDPRGIHALITLDDLLRMRSGLAMPCLGDNGPALGFEGAAVYFDAVDAFAAAQANIVAVRPGAVFRYINAGINVLAAIIRDRIELRGLNYHESIYALLPDILGMSSYRMSADIAGNLIGSGAAFATLRDWAKLAVLYLQDGMWNGERLLPEGWAEYALAATHGGTSYAATFWTNADRRFPALPPDAAWLSGASDQRVFILRDAHRVVAVSNETDAKMDLGALNMVLAAAIAVT